MYNETWLIIAIKNKSFGSDPYIRSPLLRHLPCPILQWWGGGAWLMTTHFHGPWEHHSTASQLREPAATPLHSSRTHPAPCGVCGNVLCVYVWWKRTFSDLMAVYNISSGLPSLSLPSSLYTHEDISPWTITCLLLSTPYAWLWLALKFEQEHSGPQCLNPNCNKSPQKCSFIQKPLPPITCVINAMYHAFRLPFCILNAIKTVH